MTRRAVAITVVLLLGAIPTFGAYAGRPLSAVILELQNRGLNIIYSSKLVKPEMRVKSEPVATEPRRILDEILAPHALVSKDGPGGVILIVEAPREEESQGDKQRAAATREKMPVSLASIVVTPGDLSLLGGQSEQRQFLTRSELQRLPALGDDVFRAMARLPGAATSEISAQLMVRGGESNDMLVLLDGLELYEPFHLKDFNVFSIVDTEAIGSVDFLSGGFPAEYGGRMGGVIDMGSLNPPALRTYLGASFTHARFLSQGRFDDDRGEWLVSARRGYIDVALNLVHAISNNVWTPRYYDVFGKVQHRIGEQSVLSFDVLAALDHVRFHGSMENDDGSYGNEYAWLNLRTAYTPRLSSETVASIGRVRGRRTGGFDKQDQSASVEARRSFAVAGLKQDWMFDVSDHRQYIKWGFVAKRFDAHYDYASSSIIRFSPVQVLPAPIVANRTLSIDPRGNSVAFYGADRFRLASSLIAEAGVRWERESWSGAGEITPRLNIAYNPVPSTAIRASWGRYRQPQAMNELHVEDGDTSFYRAQIAEQTALGIEQRLASGIDLRVEIYRKEISRVQPRYENLFDSLEFFPEVRYDRIRISPDKAFARGVELTVKAGERRDFTWWFSVAHSTAVDRIGGQDVPRPWDQPNALSFTLNYRKSDLWNFNLSGLYHSGWPTTGLTAGFVERDNRLLIVPSLGPRNGERWPAYARLDVRASRSVRLKHGTFGCWFDVMNLLNRKNPVAISGFSFNVNTGAGLTSVKENDAFLGWLPSFGVAWEF